MDHCVVEVREEDKRQTVLACVLSARPTSSHHLYVLWINTTTPQKNHTNLRLKSLHLNQHSGTEKKKLVLSHSPL